VRRRALALVTGTAVCVAALALTTSTSWANDVTKASKMGSYDKTACVAFPDVNVVAISRLTGSVSYTVETRQSKFGWVPNQGTGYIFRDVSVVNPVVETSLFEGRSCGSNEGARKPVKVSGAGLGQGFYSTVCEDNGSVDPEMAAVAANDPTPKSIQHTTYNVTTSRCGGIPVVLAGTDYEDASSTYTQSWSGSFRVVDGGAVSTENGCPAGKFGLGLLAGVSVKTVASGGSSDFAGGYGSEEPFFACV